MTLPIFDLCLDKNVESKSVSCLWFSCWFRSFRDVLFVYASVLAQVCWVAITHYVHCECYDDAVWS